MGSNIFNILAILGISALIYPIVVQKSSWLIEIPLVILLAVVVLVQSNDIIIDGASVNLLARTDGLLLICLFLLFMAYVSYLAHKGDMDPGLEIKGWSIPVSVFFILLGAVFVGTGGKIIVDSAVFLARTLGWSERIIGITIVSIGTSLPELATSAVAASKKNSDIAVGNILGSNIFNVLFVLGITVTINPFQVSPAAQSDILVNIVISILLLVLVMTAKLRRLSKGQGIILLATYVAYVVYVLFFTK